VRLVCRRYRQLPFSLSGAGHCTFQKKRDDSLKDVADLLPVAATLGKEEAIAEISRASQDVGRWWP
jgi:hypothetical protein